MHPPIGNDTKKDIIDAIDLVHFLPKRNSIIVRFTKISIVRTLIDMNNRITKSFPQHTRKVIFLNNLTRNDSVINKHRAKILKKLYESNKSIKAYKASGGKLGIVVREGDKKSYIEPENFNDLLKKYGGEKYGSD